MRGGLGFAHLHAGPEGGGRGCKGCFKRSLHRSAAVFSQGLTKGVELVPEFEGRGFGGLD